MLFRSMQKKGCIWELVYTSSDKLFLTRIRLIKCVKCTDLNHVNADCVVNSITNQLMIIRKKI